jgi:hypothetical protein
MQPMNRSQKYISILLERLPKWELRSYEHQTSLDRIRDKITSASNIQSELQSLYRVNGFSEFALSLMWIAAKVEKDTSLDESTLAEETLVFEKLRQALGDISDISPNANSQDQTVSLPGSDSNSMSAPHEPMFGVTPSAEPTPTPAVLLDSWGVEQQGTPQTPSVTGTASWGPEQERSFASSLERFLESVQSGSDDRTTLLSSMIHECKTAVQSASLQNDFKQFCELFVEFLQFVSDNQFLDDIRVMNIVSNVQDPIAQWTRTEQPHRADMLSPAIEILRDFKTMFE